jgi:hypothetical protein
MFRFPYSPVQAVGQLACRPHLELPTEKRRERGVRERAKSHPMLVYPTLSGYHFTSRASPLMRR